MPPRLASTFFATVAALGVCASASAGGYEFPGDGTRAIGRGGAFSARADDPMAVVVNPAALAALPGTQLMVSGHLLFAKGCFSRNQPGIAADGTTPTAPAWDPAWGTNPNSTNPDGRIDYTEVCNDKSERLTVVPSMAVSWRISRNVGMGFGLIPPNTERGQRWGNASYVTTTANGSERGYGGYVGAPPGSAGPGANPLVPLDNGQSLLPAPSRFQLVERDVIVLYPTIAVGAKPFRWLQIGAAFGWGIARARLVSNIRTLFPGEEPSLVEGQARLDGRDWFAPRVSASVHFIPHDNVDIVGVFRWDDTIRAKGNVTAGVPILDNEAASGLNSLNGTGTLIAPRPWWLIFGIRYADRISARPDDPDEPGRKSGRVEDPMSAERWDLEVNVVYEKNSVVDSLVVELENLDAALGSAVIRQPINAELAIGHNWQDQISVRLGGDWNIKPAVFTLRGGFSYETSGFTGIGSRTSKGGTIDFMPGQRFGFHLGLTGRIKRAELSAAFSYFQMTTHNNGNGGTEQVVITPENGGAQLAGDTVNNGAFSSRYVVMSAAFRYFFEGWGGRK